MVIKDKGRHIPTDLKRRILVEAGHRCSIPTCRSLNVDIHHIMPWEKSKKHEYKNLIALCPNCHRRAEKGEIDRKSLYMYKDNLRYIIEKYSKFEIDVLFTLSRKPRGEGLSIPTDLYLLVNRLMEDELIEFQVVPGRRITVMDFDLTPVLMVITKKGEDFIQNISKKKIGYERL
jgi:hypothetical protein